MQALLAGDPETGLPSMRGKVDLIYIDPPFDSKADYRTKVTLPGANIEQRPTTIEQFAYADTWSRDFAGDVGLVRGTAAYLAYMYPRLVLMQALLKDTGSLYVHLDPTVGHYVKILLDEIFGKENFQRELIWRIGWISGYKSAAKNWIRNHDNILFYVKDRAQFYFKKSYIPYPAQYVRRDGNPPTGQGYPIEDTWNCSDLDRMDSIQIMSFSGEKVGYATQKNENVLERITRASSPDSGLVLDVFSGSGTTAAVAEKLGRKWIAVDLGKPACMVTRKRLIDQGAAPFLYQSIGDYQKEHLAATMGTKYRVGDLAQVVLGLYGALPFPQGENPNRNLGYLPNSRTLVMVDSPNKLCGRATLERAQRERGTFRGGWEKIVVLGWNFVPDIGQSIRDLDDPKLEVLVIPPDLLDKLSSKTSYKKLVDSGGVRFSSLQYLTIKEPRVRKVEGDEVELSVELENYTLLSPDALPLDDANKEKLREVIAKSPLDLIEYWSIDPDYDGQVFRSTWQDYRGNTENDDDPLRVVRSATIRVPDRPGPRTICVKAVDVFGWESEVRATLPPAH
jgi:adenine specific DNA methylase Mod